MSEITPKWTMTAAAVDKFSVSFFCPFCGEEETFGLSPHNVDIEHINHWVARGLRDHVLEDCSSKPHRISVYAPQGDDDWGTHVLLLPDIGAGQVLLKAHDGYLYYLTNEELLAMAANLEDSGAALLNRAQNLRSLV